MDKYEKTKQNYEDGLDWHAEKSLSYKWNKTMDRFLELLKGNKVLDAGCGVGRDTNTFTQKNLEVIGVDYSKITIAKAKELFPKSKFVEGNMMKLEFSDASFDGLWSCASLLNIQTKDVPTVLKEFHRVLKPSGVIFISVKKGKGEEFVPDREGERWFKFYEKEELENLLTSHGFKIIESEVIDNEDLIKNKLSTTNLPWLCVYATKQ